MALRAWPRKADYTKEGEKRMIQNTLLMTDSSPLSELAFIPPCYETANKAYTVFTKLSFFPPILHM